MTTAPHPLNVPGRARTLWMVRLVVSLVGVAATYGLVTLAFGQSDLVTLGALILGAAAVEQASLFAVRHLAFHAIAEVPGAELRSVNYGRWPGLEQAARSAVLALVAVAFSVWATHPLAGLASSAIGGTLVVAAIRSAITWRAFIWPTIARACAAIAWLTAVTGPFLGYGILLGLTFGLLLDVMALPRRARARYRHVYAW